MSQYIERFIGYAERLGTQEWALLLIGVVLVGYFCLRGFGSRSGY